MILPPASLAKVDSAPNDLWPFLRAPLIRSMPSFWPWAHRSAQDSIKPGQWVKVESGDHRGAIGKPRDVVHSVAPLALTSTGNDPDLLIPLRALAPLYRCGDNVKCRWSESCGLVIVGRRGRNDIDLRRKGLQQYRECKYLEAMSF